MLLACGWRLIAAAAKKGGPHRVMKREHEPPTNVEEPSTPLDAAKALIRPYVERGDPIGWYLSRRLGYWGEAYGASIGAVMPETGEWRELVPDQIAVSRAR